MTQESSPEAERPRGWRGTGLHIAGGSFRVRNIGFVIDNATGEVEMKPVIPELAADTCPQWIALATEGIERARRGRDAGVVAPEGDNSVFHPALEDEYRGAVVAITSAAFALDAFYGSTVARAPETRAPSKRRTGRISETLKLAYEIRGTQQQDLRQSVREIFRLRDEAVHPHARFVSPIQHPIYGLGMEPRYVWYRLENAEIVDLAARRIIWFCLNHPKRRHAALAEWCDAFKGRMTPPDEPDAASAQ